MLVLVDDGAAQPAAQAQVADRVYGPADFEGPAYSNKVGIEMAAWGIVTHSTLACPIKVAASACRALLSPGCSARQPAAIKTAVSQLLQSRQQSSGCVWWCRCLDCMAAAELLPAQAASERREGES